MPTYEVLMLSGRDKPNERHTVTGTLAPDPEGDHRPHWLRFTDDDGEIARFRRDMVISVTRTG